MAFDFGAALGSAGQLYPAYQAGQDIREQRARERQAALDESRLKNQEIAASKANVQLGQQREALAERTKSILPFGDPFRKSDGKYYQKAITERGIEDIPLEGYDPIAQQSAEKESELKSTYDRFVKTFKREPTAYEQEQMFGGIKPQPFKTTSTVVPDPKSATGFSKVEYDQLTGQEYSREDTLPPRSFVSSQTDSAHFDPITGTTSTTSSTRRPLLPGQGGGGASSPAPAAQHAISALTSPGGASSSPAPQTETASSLDASGHIPGSLIGRPFAGSRITSSVLSAANDLLDGKDEDKIEGKVRPLARALAQRYGWEQGKFTPLQRTQLREATYRLTKALSSPALSVLDNPSSHARVTAMTLQPGAGVGGTVQGLGRYLSNVGAGPIGQPTQQEQDFRNMLTQLRETVQGMSSLVRTGRPTERMVAAMQANLPEPETTTSSADARAKLKLLLKQLQIAQVNGNLDNLLAGTDADQGGGQGGFDPDAVLRKAGVIR